MNRELGSGQVKVITAQRLPSSPLSSLPPPSLPGLMDDPFPQPGRLWDNLAFGLLMEDHSERPRDAALTTSVPSFRGG